MINNSHLTDTDEDIETHHAQMYIDPRVVASAEDYIEDAIGDDFVSGRSQNNKVSRGSVLLKGIAQSNSKTS